MGRQPVRHILVIKKFRVTLLFNARHISNNWVCFIKVYVSAVFWPSVRILKQPRLGNEMERFYHTTLNKYINNIYDYLLGKEKLEQL